MNTSSKADSTYPGSLQLYCIGVQCQSGASFSNPFRGIIDEVAIFNVKRNATEILSDMNQSGLKTPLFGNITRLSPANNGITNGVNINMSCSARALNTVQNVSNVSFLIYDETNTSGSQWREIRRSDNT